MLVAASALYAFGLWWMTLRPTPYDDGTAGVLRAFLGLLASSPATAWVTFGVVEFAANVVMFVPFGVLAILWGGAWWVGILSGLATSAVIETSQALFLPTRVADARDLLANTLGTALGVAVGLLVARAVRLHSERIADAIESS
ncbi:VanZ family protein [Microbacterium sp. IEGM 1404]|uniref:VanZ family protein n=1 Tax=Microbacterium sp. IEGM 1404 TaxID=3047084 RepID=UPI0024B7ACA2|nr:VanZ family protein [Microbacterium sp. IEGM 1404]MDI9889866.1 VanZ family protein [Microbacterium sp. IEGM 1404]